MGYTWLLTLALAAQTAGGPPQPAFKYPQVDLQGRLYRSVFAPGPGTLSSGDIATLPENLRSRLSRFLVQRAGFTSHYESAPADIESVARDAKRRAIEQSVTALIESPDAAAPALAFVKGAPIAYEWEGMPDGPLAESAYAEQTLKEQPTTLLAPYLYLFIAQRQRAAAEAADRTQDKAVTTAALAKYRDYLSRARSAPDPIFALIADDMERMPYVYVRKSNDKN
ncbi:MAG TPA: hypothetical protein VHI99_00695 [Vicinamibacterales bacterium]|jgi:hypothetical protein|nr:hypothetical protein [Vicinamibacterales bacterium]